MIFSISLNAEELFDFQDLQTEKRYYQLIDEIRCPKCTSELPSKFKCSCLRRFKEKIFELLEDGYTDQDIRNYVVERFGKDSVYQPKFSENIFLWLAPLVFIIFLLSIFHFVRR